MSLAGDHFGGLLFVGIPAGSGRYNNVLWKYCKLFYWQALDFSHRVVSLVCSLKDACEAGRII